MCHVISVLFGVSFTFLNLHLGLEIILKLVHLHDFLRVLQLAVSLIPTNFLKLFVLDFHTSVMEVSLISEDFLGVHDDGAAGLVTTVACEVPGDEVGAVVNLDLELFLTVIGYNGVVLFLVIAI